MYLPPSHLPSSRALPPHPGRYADQFAVAHDESHLTKFEELVEAAVDLEMVPEEVSGVRLLGSLSPAHEQSTVPPCQLPAPAWP